MPFSLNAFKRSIEEQNVMHGNRYIIEFALPDKLKARLSASKSTSGEFGATATFRAEQVMLPGMILSSADGIPPHLGYGSVEGIPYGIIHEDITVVFGLDDKGLVHKVFYDWLDLIVGSKAYGQNRDQLNKDGSKGGGYAKGAYEVEYKEAYYSDIDLYVLAPQHLDANYSKEHVMHIKMYRAFPKNMPSLNLSYAEKNNYLRFPVQFNYTDLVINHKKLNKTDIIKTRS